MNESQLKAKTADTSIYRFVWNETDRAQLVVVLIALLVVPLNIAPLELQKLIIDKGVLAKDIPLVAILLVVYLCISGLQALSLYLLNMQEGRIHEVVARRLRHRILKLITLKRKNKATAARPGTLVTVYSLEVDPIGEFAGEAVSVPVVDGGVFLAVMGYMFYSEPLLAGVAVAFFVPQAVLVFFVQRRVNMRVSERIKLLREGNEVALGLLDGRQGSGFSFLTQVTRSAYRLGLKIYQLKYFMKYTVLSLNYLSRIAVLGVGGYLVIQDQTTIGIVVAFLSGLERLTERWSELISFFRRMSSAKIKYSLVYDVLQPRHADA